MQVAALAWVVYDSTRSAFRTTAIAFIGIVPLLVLGPLAGVLADHFSRRKLLLLTNAANGAQAVALWLCWIGGLGGNYVLLFALSMLGGVFTAIQTPAWQSLPAELVPAEDLANAITLNSTQFNIARALGPLFAGVTIEQLGAGGAFFANAVSYLVVIVALLGLRAPQPRIQRPADDLSTMQRWFQGVQYVRERPGLVLVMSAHSLFALVAPPVVYLIPTLSVKVLHIGAGRYGALLGTFGIGAVVAAVSSGAIEHRARPSRVLAAGFALGVGAFFGLGHVHGMGPGIVAMTMFGASYLIVVSVDHGTIQMLTDDEHRGRVTSVWLMSFGLFMPIGVLGQGALTDHLGVQSVLTIDAIAMGLAVASVLAVGGVLDRARYSNSNA
jgi:MFS family permease